MEWANWAQRDGRYEQTQWLLVYGMTALQCAVAHGCKSTVRLLLDMGVDLEMQYAHHHGIGRRGLGYTALYLAAMLNETDIALMLIEAGADVNTRVSHWRAPPPPSVLRHVLPRCHDCSAVSSSSSFLFRPNDTVLICAALVSSSRVVQGALPTTRDFEFIELLLRNGAELEAKDR